MRSKLFYLQQFSPSLKLKFMPKTRQQKQEVLDRLATNLEKAKSATLVSFSQLQVGEDRKLRQELHNENIKYEVIKKTLFKKSLAKAGLEGVDIEKAMGNISVAISERDEIAPAKIISRFSKSNENVSILGGILENKWIDAVKVEALAKLSSKEELIARTVGAIKAPLSGVVNVLAGGLRGLLNVLREIKEAK